MKPDVTQEIPVAEKLGHVHLVGIGGAGMSGIARLLAARGLAVSGSDARGSAMVDALRADGITVHVGHDAGHVDDADTVVVSTAVRESNPELARARERGLPVLHRSQALAALMAGSRVVAVAGTHGKTTTTGMVTVVLRESGGDPSFAIGGELTEGGENAHAGTGNTFVAEADESDGSFLVYAPRVAILTNVEPDHLDHYGTPEAVREAFAAFVRRVEPGGAVVWCADDEGAREVLEGAHAVLAERGVRSVSYGTSSEADLRVEEIEPDGAGMRFVLDDAGRRRRVGLRVPGRHNALNATAAYAAATCLGFDPGEVAEALGAFGGTRRRFEAKGEAGGVRVVDDYAHHPTEVAAVLRAARAVAGDGRVVVAFQPHLFSRTRIFADEFATALGLADEVVVLDVYAAREDPDPEVTGALIADRIPLPGAAVGFLPQGPDLLARAARELADRARPGDLVLTVGAGDVTAVGPLVLQLLHGSAPDHDRAVRAS